MEADLRAYAFGAAHQLPDLDAASAGTPWQRFYAAVIHGVRGRYARACTLLEPLARDADPVLASLACSTRASQLRQLGAHTDARGWDSLALRKIADVHDRADTMDGLDAAGARADALIGLAADAIGIGDAATARVLADRADPAGWRTSVRLDWVRAETALLTGDASSGARHAQGAADRAQRHGARRHKVKSDIVLAAATTDREKSRKLAESAYDVAESAGWDSLAWPAARVAAEFDGRFESYAERLIRVVLRHADPIGRMRAVNSGWTPVRE